MVQLATSQTPASISNAEALEKQNLTCFDPDGLMVITVGLKHMRGGVADAPPYTESALATDGLALGPENCWNEAVSALAQGSPIARKQTREMVFRSKGFEIRRARFRKHEMKRHRPTDLPR